MLLCIASGSLASHPTFCGIKSSGSFQLRHILHELNWFFHLHFTDTPTAASANNGSTSTSQSNNDLDIFGPMVSNPLPASTSAAPFTQVDEKWEKEAATLLV